MKVKHSQETRKTRISELAVGDTFLAKRSRSDENVVYMIINLCGYDDSKMAVNLNGGQIRSFKGSTWVMAVKTEVRVLIKISCDDLE